MNLQPHQQRVVDEKNEVSDRLSKLYAFFRGPIFPTLSEAEQSRLLDFGRRLKAQEPRDDFPDDYEV